MLFKGSVYRSTLQLETDDIRHSVDIAEVRKATARKGEQFVTLTETTLTCKPHRNLKIRSWGLFWIHKAMFKNRGFMGM